MHFMGWGTPFKVCEDAFHLHKSEECPDWMSKYFDDEGNFLLDLLMETICQEIEESIDAIFASAQKHKNMRNIYENIWNICVL